MIVWSRKISWRETLEITYEGYGHSSIILSDWIHCTNAAVTYDTGLIQIRPASHNPYCSRPLAVILSGFIYGPCILHQDDHMHFIIEI